jgi:hypothetical protein
LPEVANPLAPVVPGQTPGTTPPTFGGQAGTLQNPMGVTSPVAAPDDTVKRILATLAQQAAIRGLGVKPTVPAVPGQRQAQVPGYMTGPYSKPWGFERFAQTVGTSLQSAANAHKEKQIQKAEADWEYMGSAMEELEAAKAGGNPQAIQQAQSKLDLITTDPKKLKNMVKVFQQDWLAPEKTTPYGEAYKRVVSKMQQKDAAKKHAFGKIADFFRSKSDMAMQQMTPEERQRMGQEIQSRAPMTPAGQIDPKMLIELQKNLGEEAYKAADIGLRERELTAKTEETKEARLQRQQQHEEDLEMKQQTLQLHYDDLAAKIEDSKQRALDRQANEQDRKLQWAQMNAMRGDQLQLTKQMDDARIQSMSGDSPKDRKTAWDQVIKSQRDTWMQANKDRMVADKAYVQRTLGLVDRDATVDSSNRAKAATALAERLASDVQTGKIDPQTANDQVYSMYDKNAWKPVNRGGKIIGYTSDGKTMIPVGQ